jgi:hypothetical protein
MTDSRNLGDITIQKGAEIQDRSNRHQLTSGRQKKTGLILSLLRGGEASRIGHYENKEQQAAQGLKCRNIPKHTEAQAFRLSGLFIIVI